MSTSKNCCRRCGSVPIFDLSDKLCSQCCFEVDNLQEKGESQDEDTDLDLQQ